MSEPSPADELATLARALRAEGRRARRRGRRRILLEPRIVARPPQAPGSSPSPRAAAAPQAQGGPSAPADRRAPSQAPRSSPASPADSLPESPGAAELRVRAAACSGLAALGEQVAACIACELHRTRTQTVFGEGSGRRRVMFVGEAPGAEEDARGRPFVGPAGKLLDDIITKGMGLAREDVYIANVLKCRPPSNRDPRPAEKALCGAWLERQIELVDPEVLIPLGAHAAGHLLGVTTSIGRLRGRVHRHGGRRVVPTYHPAFLLRSPEFKPECWKDIQLAMAALGLERPGRP